MQDYHRIWLEKHPHRSEEWLKERLSEGFDIHHADGDRSNNDHDNLMLIDHVDHMGLHGIPLNRMARRYKERRKSDFERRKKERYDLGKTFYEERQSRMSWPDIYEKHYGKIDRINLNAGAKVANVAKDYAKKAGLPWPIDVGDFKAEKIWWRGTSRRCG